MPLYGANQSGYNQGSSQELNITALSPGESMTLLASTDGTPSTSTKSVSFSRAYSPSGMDGGITFNATGMHSGMTIDVQVAAHDLDAEYLPVTTMSPDSGNNAAYTDVGRSPFYRVKISAYTSGTMPTVTANR